MEAPGNGLCMLFFYSMAGAIMVERAVRIVREPDARLDWLERVGTEIRVLSVRSLRSLFLSRT